MLAVLFVFVGCCVTWIWLFVVTCCLFGFALVLLVMLIPFAACGMLVLLFDYDGYDVFDCWFVLWLVVCTC